MVLIRMAEITGNGTRTVEQIERALDAYITTAGGDPTDDETWDLLALGDGVHAAIVAV